jgi:hypothetical protein
MKKYSIAILILFTLIVGISGCTTKTASNGTFGEKSVSINSIYISNNTTADTFKDNGTEYYVIEGYLENNNSDDAFHVIVNASGYDSNGNLVATNNSAYIEPPSIPAKGLSSFYIQFNDPNNTIARYDIKVVNADGII